MVEYKINVGRFNEKFPARFRHTIQALIRESTKEVCEKFADYKFHYWDIIGEAFNRHMALPKDFAVMNDLFPPNYAVLDWLLEIELPKSTKIADIPCGLGNLFPYLKQLGYKKIWGYDAWKQIEKEKTETFLRLCDMPKCLVDLPTLTSKPIDVVSIISLPFDWLMPDIAPILAKAKWLLIDTGYLPKSPIDGFEEVGRYPDLLVVCKRVSENGKA